MRGLDRRRRGRRAARCAAPGLVALTLGALLAGCAGGTAAARPAVCRGRPDGTLLPIPPELAPRVTATFHARMTPAEVARNGVLRCDGQAVLACLTGANLNCGPADRTRRNHGAAVWCRAHPDARFVPKFATGHTTVFDWRCAGQRAAIAAQVQQVDARGFVRGAWRALPPTP